MKELENEVRIIKLAIDTLHRHKDFSGLSEVAGYASEKMRELAQDNPMPAIHGNASHRFCNPCNGTGRKYGGGRYACPYCAGNGRIPLDAPPKEDK